MGLDAAGRWFPGLARSFADWAQHRAEVDAADAPDIAVPPEVPPGLARVWSSPELLKDPGVARWTVRWFGVMLEAGFRVLSAGPPGTEPPPADSSWAATVFDRGVTAAATKSTLPELVQDLRDVLPGLEGGLPWRPEGEAAAAEATAAQLIGRLGSEPAWAPGGVLMKLVRVRRDRRLAAYANLAAERLNFQGAALVPASHALAAALTRFLDRQASLVGAPDPIGTATIHGMRAWSELEWEAGLAREAHFQQLVGLKLERGGEPPPPNWRLGVAQRAQRAADTSFRFALGRPPETVEVAAAWQAEADLDLADAIRFADPEPDVRPGGAQAVGTWLRSRVHRRPPARRPRPGGRIR